MEINDKNLTVVIEKVTQDCQYIIDDLVSEINETGQSLEALKTGKNGKMWKSLASDIGTMQSMKGRLHKCKSVEVFKKICADYKYDTGRIARMIPKELGGTK